MVIESFTVKSAGFSVFFLVLFGMACGSRPLSFDRSNFDSSSIDTLTQRREKGLTRRYRLRLMLNNHLVAVMRHSIYDNTPGR